MDFALYGLQLAAEVITLGTVGALGLVAFVGCVVLFGMKAPD